MNYDFDINEATASEVLAYMKRKYGAQISGAPFTIYNLNNWIRIGKLPDAYGGNRIIAVQRYKELRNLLVLTIEGWDRAEVEGIIEMRSNYKMARKHKQKTDTIIQSSKLRKQRPALYFQMLDKAGKRYKEIDAQGYQIAQVQ